MNPGRPPASAAMQQATSAQLNSGAGHGSGRASYEGNDLSTVSSGTGRSEWRREEHGRFMQALENYGSRRTGDEWKLITDYVGTRTIEEVRLHGRQYLQRLVQQLPPSPVTATPNRYFTTAGSQNDPNRQNYQAMNMQFYNQSLQSVQPQQQPQQGGPTAPHRNGRRKPWTFQEDKAFETALAGWAGCKSYPWAKIAAAIPGMTAKDVRSRYEAMVGEVASIEAGDVPVPESLKSTGGARTQPPTSTLSRRAVPPPPIEVPPSNVGKDGAVGAFPSSTRSRRDSITMLSPTFLDLLANEAESEEKSPLPALPLPFPGLTNLPSPLFSPTLLPSGSPGFFSPGNKKSAARGQPDKKFSSVEGDVKMEEIDAGPPAAAGKSDDPRRSTTPRIWNDFLADDFKFDDPLGTTPSHSSRKTPRSKASANTGEGSSTTKTAESDAGEQDVEMADASAA
ncbi:Transcription factor RADIALIS [Phytophthora ramorum]|uniref:Transcription factor RADIALIS n=1 Tax=Phytophthora ramorum TaxID=164328 RepID=UPI0030ADCFB9|nr:Transcription factor RADIALIS [Phytophthora ramorum]